MTVDEAIRYLRAQTRNQAETIYYAYVLDHDQQLLGAVSLRQLLTSPSDAKIRDVMRSDLTRVPEDMDQEQVAALFSQNNLLALPVVDSQGRMRGIVTIDDVVSVVQKEATEDVHKMGGTGTLDEPYLDIGVWKMIQKRAGWLMVLFVGEMFTATAMGRYEEEIERAVVLALFIPLIISSGGNSGSQASTLVIRALALKEIRVRDWNRILGREVLSGLILGGILGVIGVLRILYWPGSLEIYGEHYVRVGFTVGISLIGIVLWGTIAGSMLPLVLRRLGFDPASASTPFVATLADVTGIFIYFTTASLVLRGTLL
jgi:magnesium transporter